MKVIRIGTRESRLAVIQAELVKAAMETDTGIQAELVTMKTTGDRILDRSLDQVGGKGLFMKELDLALAEGRTDVSVHCVKDMTMDLPEEFPVCGVSAREDPRDVLVLPKGVDQLDRSLPVGCSSKRRTLQFLKLYPQLHCESVRGNVLTRLDKLDRGEYGGLLLAAAGLKRLGLESRISRYFSVQEIIPAAGQGILAVQGRKGENLSCLQSWFDRQAFQEAVCERAFVRTLDGGCSSPIAAYAQVLGDQIRLCGLYYEAEMGSDYLTGELTGPCSEASQVGIRLAEMLRQQAAEQKQTAEQKQAKGGQV